MVKRLEEIEMKATLKKSGRHRLPHYSHVTDRGPSPAAQESQLTAVCAPLRAVILLSSARNLHLCCVEG